MNPSPKSTCIATWILKDGRTAFKQGRIYTHARTEKLSIIGENGVVMFMDEKYYSRYFQLINTKPQKPWKTN